MASWFTGTGRVWIMLDSFVVVICCGMFISGNADQFVRSVDDQVAGFIYENHATTTARSPG